MKSKEFSRSLPQMRINESMPRAGSLCANVWWCSDPIPSVTQVHSGPTLYGIATVDALHFPGSLAPAQLVDQRACHSEHGQERCWRRPGINVGTSPNSTCHCLLCHPDLMTSYKEGREQEELFTSRYLRRFLTSTVFLGMRGTGARL